MKKIGAILLCLTLCMSLVLPVFAQARWIGVCSQRCTITFVDTTGVVNAEIVGDDTVTAMTGTLKLYWGIIKLKEWTINEQDNYWGVFESFDGKSGRNYTLKLNARVCSGGVWETITDQYTEECP